jgi:hypothetical protein
VDTLLTIAEIIFLLSLAALVVRVTLAIRPTLDDMHRVADASERLEASVAETARLAKPVFENLADVTGNIRRATGSLEAQMASLRGAFEAISGMAINVVEFERQVQDRIQGPILDSAGFLAALLRGLTTFIRAVRR